MNSSTFHDHEMKVRLTDLSPSINHEWTLFLDRDGVINKPPQHIYARNWDEFLFAEGALEALSILAAIFKRIIIVSNQQGVSKGLMSKNDLVDIHSNMKQCIEQAGGRIDAVYTCTALAEDGHPERKPNTGMAQKAIADFPDIETHRSLMVGDKISDIEFGKNLSMYTVLINLNYVQGANAHYRFDTLIAFALEIRKAFTMP